MYPCVNRHVYILTRFSSSLGIEMTGKTNGAPPDNRSYRDAVVARMPPQPVRGRLGYAGVKLVSLT